MSAVETVTLEANGLHRLAVPEPPPPVSRRGSQHRPEPPAPAVGGPDVGISVTYSNVSRRNSAHASSAPAAATAPAPATSTNQHGHDRPSEEATRPRTRPPAATILLTMAPLCLSVLLSALDLTITTPAIPAIASAFGSASGYVWVGSAFSLAMTAVTPVWATVADIWGRKPVMLAAHAVFFAGSLLCARAPTMAAVIAGRAVQGVGVSGMGTMVNAIICDTFSMRDRGLYLAVTSVVWAVGSAVGPVLGGIFNTKLDWRWCFYINLPIGAVVFVVIAVFLDLPTPQTPVLAGLKAIDWAGSFLILGAALMILLGLEFGDVTFPLVLGDGRQPPCLRRFDGGPFRPRRVEAGGRQPHHPPAAVSGPLLRRLLRRLLVRQLRPHQLGLLPAPVFPIGPGCRRVDVRRASDPLIVSCSLAAAATGALIQKTGRYLPVMYVAQISLGLGTGLLIYLKFGEPLTKLFVFQVLVGLGVGMNMEPPLLAAQAAAAKMDTAVVIATIGFIRSIATSVAIVVGGVIFQNRMGDHYEELVAEVGEQVAVSFKGDQASASVGLISSLSMQDQVAVRRVYFDAFRAVWTMASSSLPCVVVAGLSLVANLFVRAHHLSAETQAVVLGVDRVIDEESRRQTDPGPRDENIGSRSIELQEGSASHVRLRS
ncbi:uncharacterized protein PG986_004839 [Apiospora aurea]|uniref:Major facilitator superfamily (MFS) profile domain-containing protein n=1 Tax=Apiospora aurea TaxID=335848 RepID=A0ABR1QGQ0_9PEZI